jgi:hypothetical protein
MFTIIIACACSVCQREVKARKRDMEPGLFIIKTDVLQEKHDSRDEIYLHSRHSLRENEKTFTELPGMTTRGCFIDNSTKTIYAYNKHIGSCKSVELRELMDYPLILDGSITDIGHIYCRRLQKADGYGYHTKGARHSSPA